MTTAERLASRIESVMKARGRSVAWLAETTGIADKTLRRRIIQPGQFNVAELDSICNALEVEAESVLNFDIPVEDVLRRVAA